VSRAGLAAGRVRAGRQHLRVRNQLGHPRGRDAPDDHPRGIVVDEPGEGPRPVLGVDGARANVRIRGRAGAQHAGGNEKSEPAKGSDPGGAPHRE